MTLGNVLITFGEKLDVQHGRFQIVGIFSVHVPHLADVLHLEIWKCIHACTSGIARNLCPFNRMFGKYWSGGFLAKKFLRAIKVSFNSKNQDSLLPVKVFQSKESSWSDKEQ